NDYYISKQFVVHLFLHFLYLNKSYSIIIMITVSLSTFAHLEWKAFNVDGNTINSIRTPQLSSNVIGLYIAIRDVTRVHFRSQN
ncbi:MAG TPA: hypothetical protein VFJ51_14530, partial [Nitrososphaeraceae archaeon]|nr:hypothetical protein [Nitrososphaeraceae archaeon]